MGTGRARGKPSRTANPPVGEEFGEMKKQRCPSGDRTKVCSKSRSLRQFSDRYEGGWIYSHIPLLSDGQVSHVELFISFHDEDTSVWCGCEERIQKVQHFRLSLDPKGIRGRTKNGPRFFAQVAPPTAPDKRVARNDRDSLGRLECLGIFANHVGGRKMLLDARRDGCPAAEGFECQGTRPGEQVDRVHSFDVGSDEIKYSFSNAVLHRPRARIAGILQLSVPPRPADNSQRRDRFCGTRVVGWVGVRAFFGHVMGGTLQKEGDETQV